MLQHQGLAAPSGGDWKRSNIRQPPTLQVAEPYEEVTAPDWSDPAKEAYRALCATFFDQEQWSPLQTLSTPMRSR